MSLYKSIEKRFFNSLTKKITGNVIFLLIPHLLLVFLSVYHSNNIDHILNQLDISDADKGVMAEALNALWFSGSVTVLVALLAGVTTIFFMRHLFMKPIFAVTEVLSAIKEKDGDISATLPIETHDEISILSNSYNDFSQKLKDMIADTRSRSVNVAFSAARLKKVIGQAHYKAGEQEQSANEVFQSSNEASKAIEEIAASTLQISEQNSTNLEDVRASKEELLKVQDQIEAIRDLVNRFQETVVGLHTNSQNITSILTMVQDFSDQTNLLALNASIEAARAGEAGRGFAVVADEVRGLAKKVGDATSLIDKNITKMSGLVSDTDSSAKNILGYIETTGEFIEHTNGQFGQLVEDFEQVNSQLSSISAAIDELAYTNKNSLQHVDKITRIATDIKAEMDHSQDFSEQLEVSTEESQELLSRFIIGYGAFENIIQKVKAFKSDLDTKLVEIKNSSNLFDRNYQRVNPGQEPAKFNSSYAELFDRELQPLYDQFIAKNPELIYSVLVDRNGYIATHHKKVSNPLTGDFERDNSNSRNRRIFFDTRSEQRRATHTQPFLLQTYVRDTGEILNELSIPVYLDTQHWGALIVGFDPKVLLKS
jgi:methyl-accepting chemotaxis protein